MRRCRVEAKLPVLVFRMPGGHQVGHQVVLTTAENGLPSFTVTLHTENNWKFCGPAELLNVLQPIHNQPEAAMASWQLEHPTPTEGDSGDWTVAMRKVIKNILHYVGEDPETVQSVLQDQSRRHGGGSLPPDKPRPVPHQRRATPGTTDPTPTETTGYSDGETESLDDNDALELEDATHLFFDQTNEEPELEDIGAVGGLPRLDMDTALYNNLFKEVCDREEVSFMDYSEAFPTSQRKRQYSNRCFQFGHWAGKCPFNVRNAKKDEPKQQGRTHPCSVCHELGHWRADCPYNQGNDLGSA
ncbi:hypothetical protein Bbelb_050260 [Branchiostoma belcheri]|nr:hypothetical protein Bbelb_050260 [Branchiostoma belcheri]